jgi:hypothetical protein
MIKNISLRSHWIDKNRKYLQNKDRINELPSDNSKLIQIHTIEEHLNLMDNLVLTNDGKFYKRNRVFNNILQY